jgi:hypothetical protein
VAVPAPTPRDPAHPGKAQAIIDAMHRAGMRAPGDLARAAAAAARRLLPASRGGSNGTAAGGGALPSPSSVPLTHAANAAHSHHHFAEGEAAAGVEGCRLAGYVDVARVPGTLRISVVQDGSGLTLPSLSALNLSHIVHDFFVGPRLTAYQLSRLPPAVEGELHALRGGRFISTPRIRLPPGGVGAAAAAATITTTRAARSASPSRTTWRCWALSSASPRATPWTPSDTQPTVTR